MQHFLITFMILLLLSSIFICTIHYLTRHTIEVQPDNTIKINGYLLKYWSVFLEKVLSYRKVYYSGEALEYKYKYLHGILPNVFGKFEFFAGKSLVLKEPLTPDQLDKFEKAIGCQYEINGDAYFLYIEEPVYRFPEWVRKPLGSCPVCMSSVYGSAIWLSINHISHNLFSWTNHKTEGFFLFWLMFIVLLCTVCSIVYRKTSQYVL